MGHNQDKAHTGTQGHDVHATPTGDAMGDRVCAAHVRRQGLLHGDKLDVDKMIKHRSNVDKLVCR